MTKKLTQKEADIIDIACGVIPIGKYLGNKVPREYQCGLCDRIYTAKPNHIRSGKQLICLLCSNRVAGEKRIHPQKQINDRDISLGAIPVGLYINSKTPRAYKCNHCGILYDVTPSQMKTKPQIYCKKCNWNTGGKKRRIPIDKIRKEICAAGFIPMFTDNEYKTTETKLRLRCKCGRECCHISHCNIVHDKVRTCGNCKLRRNGLFTSNTALELHQLIEHITGLIWQHNYFLRNTNRQCCIDIANEGLKIAIEYDSYYNHKIRNGDRTTKDIDKHKSILQAGWKLLIIKSDGYDIPTEKQLHKILLNDFQHNTHKKTITMLSWKQQHQKYNNV